MSLYADTTALTTYGLPATALGNLTVPQQNAALGNASEIVDSYLRGRYDLPLVTWGVEITEATCKIAAYNLLSVRGYNPASSADVNIRDRYLDAIAWLVKIQKQQAHPDVTPSAADAPNFDQPFLISSSVVNLASGGRASNRGWAILPPALAFLDSIDKCGRHIKASSYSGISISSFYPQFDEFHIPFGQFRISSISTLFFGSGPSNISWFIIAISIWVAVYRMSLGRSRTNIIYEGYGIINPRLVHSNTFIHPQMTLWMARVKTSILNALPRSVFSYVKSLFCPSSIETMFQGHVETLQSWGGEQVRKVG